MARSGPWNMTPISDSRLVISSAPPTPWSSRPAIRISLVPAAPQAIELIVNSAIPSANVRRRPIRSPTRPAVIRNTAVVSPYPAATHSRPPLEAWRSVCIDGIATLTMKKSSTTMNAPDRTTGSAAQGLRAVFVRGPVGAAGLVMVVVLMPSTVPPGSRPVDYRRGNVPCAACEWPRALDRRGVGVPQASGSRVNHRARECWPADRFRT